MKRLQVESESERLGDLQVQDASLPSPAQPAQEMERGNNNLCEGISKISGDVPLAGSFS